MPFLARAKEKALARPLSNPDPCRFVPPFFPYRTPRRMGFGFALAFTFLRAGPGTHEPGEHTHPIPIATDVRRGEELQEPRRFTFKRRKLAEDQDEPPPPATVRSNQLKPPQTFS